MIHARQGIPTIAIFLACVPDATSAESLMDAQPPQAHASAEPFSLTGDGLSKLTFEINADYRFGNIDGYVQTPSGGEPGTSSHHRPTFNELGIDTASIFDFSIAARWDHHIVSAGGQIIRLQGDSTLSADLISQSALFPAGTRVSSDVQLDWYRFGYQYAFDYALDDGAGLLRFAPGVDADLFDFSYTSQSSGAAHVHRSYAKAGLRIGGSIEWQTDGPFSVEASAYWGLPITSTARVLSLEVTGRYQLWGGRQSGGSLVLGVGYESLEYEDGQSLPNHIHANMGPLLIAGLRFQF